MRGLKRDRKISLDLKDQDLRDAIYYLGFLSKRKREKWRKRPEKGEGSR